MAKRLTRGRKPLTRAEQRAATLERLLDAAELVESYGDVAFHRDCVARLHGF